MSKYIPIQESVLGAIVSKQIFSLYSICSQFSKLLPTTKNVIESDILVSNDREVINLYFCRLAYFLKKINVLICHAQDRVEFELTLNKTTLIAKLMGKKLQLRFSLEEVSISRKIALQDAYTELHRFNINVVSKEVFHRALLDKINKIIQFP